MPLGASDYLRLAHDFHTLVLDRVPVMHYEHRNFAKRFITLIDTLYDNCVKLVASADADPLSLYLATEGVEVNEFKRTSSRLIEMGSEILSGAAARQPRAAARQRLARGPDRNLSSFELRRIIERAAT